MLRLFVFLFTGWWPSAASVRALRRSLDDLKRAHETLQKRFNTLAGSYYQETGGSAETETVAPPGMPQLELAAETSDFPEDEFQRQLTLKRSVLHG